MTEKEEFISAFGWIFLDCSKTMIERKCLRRFLEIPQAQRIIFLREMKRAGMALHKKTEGKPYGQPGGRLK